MGRTKWVMAAAATLLSLAFAPAAQAQVDGPYSNSLSFTTTNFNNTGLSIPKFNPALGTLQSISLSFSAQIKSRLRVENLSQESADEVTGIVSGQVQLDREGSESNIITAGPNLIAGTELLATYDGSTDYDGLSGHDFGTQTASASGNALLTGAADKVAFTGPGNYVFSVDAVGTSTVSGGGNLSTLINTEAAAQVTVTYNYLVDDTEGVPEPASMALFGAGAVALAGLRRRKKG